MSTDSNKFIKDLVDKFSSSFGLYDFFHLPYQKDLMHLIPIIHSTYEPFSVKMMPYAQFGDAIIKVVIVRAFLDANKTPGATQNYISSYLCNKWFAQFYRENGLDKFVTCQDHKSDHALGSSFEALIGLYYIKQDFKSVMLIFDTYLEYVSNKINDSTVLKMPKAEYANWMTRSGEKFNLY